jgi:hypothetical protein
MEWPLIEGTTALFRVDSREADWEINSLAEVQIKWKP